MKSRSLLAAMAAGMLAFALALGTLHAAPRHKMAHKGAANAALSQIGAVSVLPPNVAPFNAASAPPSQPFVTTSAPPCLNTIRLCGVWSAYNNAVAVYPGIQYATARRWQAPTLTTLTARQLTGFGPACPQQAPESVVVSEDCLYLNVWVPPGKAPSGGYAVMVYIHGGAFITGAGSSPWYDGTAFAMNNVILVTLNYRLGALGFLDCPSSCNQYGVNATGNYGIMDQQKALQWVQANIGAFGGDPAKVTIFGESAGAMSVGLHLFSIPSSNSPVTSLFRAAIMESNPLGLVYQLATSAGPTTIGNNFLMALCAEISPTACNGNLSNPSTAPLSAVLAVQMTFLNYYTSLLTNGYYGLRGLPWQPVIDGTLIISQPYQGYVPGRTTPKPMVFGINRDEGAVFAASVAAESFTVLSNTPPSGAPVTTVYDTLGNNGFVPNSYDPVVFGCYNKPCFATQLANTGARGNSRYYYGTKNPPNYQPNAYYNNNGQAGANIVTDYDFAIGNIVMANKAATQTTQPMYAYYFTQPPLWDIYGTADNGACGPTSGGGGNACHAAELPYVFNTLAIVAPPPTTPPPVPWPPSANVTLASAMNRAWVAFAANPAAPGPPWIGYTNNNNQGTALILNTSNLPPTRTGPLDPNSVYNIWWPTCYSGALPPVACNNLSSGAAHQALPKKKAVH